MKNFITLSLFVLSSCLFAQAQKQTFYIYYCEQQSPVVKTYYNCDKYYYRVYESSWQHAQRGREDSHYEITKNTRGLWGGSIDTVWKCYDCIISQKMMTRDELNKIQNSRNICK